MNLTRKQELCSTPVTLNGKPAAISGTMMQFAMIRELGTGLGKEWSWEAVELVVSRRAGAFKA